MHAASGKFKGYTTEMTKNHHHHQKVDQCIDYFVLYQLQYLHGPKSLQLWGTKSYIVYVYVYQTISICISKISFTLHGLYYHIVIKKNKKCQSMNLLLLKLFPPKLMLLDRVCEIRRFGLQYIYDRVIIDLLSFTQSNYIYYVCPM